MSAAHAVSHHAHSHAGHEVGAAGADEAQGQEDGGRHAGGHCCCDGWRLVLEEERREQDWMPSLS